MKIHQQKKPLLSIVTVVYNGVQTIEATIRSVIYQSFTDYEYIIIDGGSTDGTVDIIKKYTNYLTYWVSEHDHGIYDAMNKGISRASGEWIHFRNCGDYFLSQDTLTVFFKQPISPDVDIVHGMCYHVYENGYTIGKPDILWYSYKERMPFLHPSTFVRLSLQKTYMFDTQYLSSADYDFFYKCLSNGVKHEYRPILVSYFADGGFSTNWQRAYFEDCKIQGMSKVQMYVNYIRKSLRKTLHDYILENVGFINKRVMNKRKAAGWSILPLPVPMCFEKDLFAD